MTIMDRVEIKRPLKVAVLCSGRAPGLLHVLHRDPARGSEYDIVCCITSHDTFAEQVRVERRGIPCVPHPLRTFAALRGTRTTDLVAREEYDRQTVDLLAPFSPDVVLLDGYLLLLMRPILSRFAGRVINIHHSDLQQRRDDGGVRYPGLRAVRDALLAGEPETRATAHIVTERLDDGPVLLRSWAFEAPPVARWALEHDAADVLKAAAWAHQEWMLRDAWGPMIACTLELARAAYDGEKRPLNLARIGRWALASDGTLTPDGAMLELV